MIWKTVISFTDKNTPKRYKVATAPMHPVKEAHLVNIIVDEIDEHDQKINSFDFIFNTRDHTFQADQETMSKPLLLITEHMEELVKDGEEKW